MSKALQYYHDNEVVKTDLYETLVTEIKVEKKQFHSLSQGLYPAKPLTNQIGSACGIEFSSSVLFQDVKGDSITDRDGNTRTPTVGIRCIKQGKKRRPDGTWQFSSPCSYVFNWVDRAEEDSLKGSTEFTPQRLRQKQLEYKRFSDQRASTGAELIVIRELTGMPTSFKEADLNAAEWNLKFSQICKSKALQAAEAQAKVENIRNNGFIAQNVESASLELTGGSAGFANEFEHPTTPADTQPDTIEPETTHPDQTEGKSPDQINYEALLNDTRVDQGMRDYYNGILNSPDGQADSAAFYKWAVGDIKSSLGAA